MVTEIRIYYEGSRLLRSGFDAFFTSLKSRAKANRCRVTLVAAGSGGTACRDFGIAIPKMHPTAWNILLKDSEGPHYDNLSVSLCGEWQWDKSRADLIFWMVEMMESWFHADKDSLEKFYDTGFSRNALKANPNVEQISKKDLKEGLRAATKNTQKGDYYDDKTSHGPKLLALINPDLVQKAAPNCRKLFETILVKLP